MIAERVTKEINARLGFLLDVGLDYLSLSRLRGHAGRRRGPAHPPGQPDRSGLVGTLYVLDEPSIGLHQRDNRRLIDTLLRLRDLGNTVLVVEHDEETIREADWIVDIGPGAGEHGGDVVYSGPVKGIIKVDDSITGQYLAGKKSIPLPRQRRQPGLEWLEVKGAREHNLRNIDVRIPLGCFVAITGVSGSGKCTLVRDILLPVLMQRIYKSKHAAGKHKKIDGIDLLDKVIDMDQSPIGRTPRSNPATYTGVFDNIRKLFATTAEAKVRGYMPGRFSFNVQGGRCEACSGDGTIKIEMHFLPDVYVPCEVCKGARYNRDTLDIAFKGKNIAEVLDMPISEAVDFFANQPAIGRHMQTLLDVGLGYVRLGQPAPTLSGGEAQRVKLASELAKRSTGHTIYLLDEPTTGLHFDDVRRLLDRAVAVGRPGQHRADHRAQPRCHQDRRLADRSRAGRWQRRRADRRRGQPRGCRRSRRQPHRPVPAAAAAERLVPAQPLAQLVEPFLLGLAERVHPRGADLVEQLVEFALVGRHGVVGPTPRAGDHGGTTLLLGLAPPMRHRDLGDPRCRQRAARRCGQRARRPPSRSGRTAVGGRLGRR